ncbi:MAG: SDR family oxidoreductase [bacterium]|nr:SDR family oxidoreductase [bacterium]
MIKRFTITQEMVDAFVRLTGDRNAMHVDPEYARRSRYRHLVVHGMLPFSFLACVAEDALPGGVDLVECTTRFHRPVQVGDTLVLEVRCEPSAREPFVYEAEWRAESPGGPVITSAGRLCLVDGSCPTEASGGGSGSLLTEELDEAVRTLADLPGLSDGFRFRMAAEQVGAYRREVLAPGLSDGDSAACPGGGLMAAIMLSPLVGMRLPGRYATFSAFDFAAELRLQPDTTYSLAGAVEGVSVAGGTADLSASFLAGEQTHARAKLRVTVNPPPKPMLACREIREHHLSHRLRGKVVLVTGASRGIGETTAKLFAMHGATVAVNYFTGRADAEAIVADIVSEGGSAAAFSCDIRCRVQVHRLVQQLVRRWGRVDVLVNNAVRDAQPQPLLEVDWADYAADLEVALSGMHNCCREFIPLFRCQGSGKIINLSTIYVDQPVPGQNRYITVKSAVVGYTRSLARELAPDNIQVNLVCPTTTETDSLAGLPEALVRRMGEERPAGRNLAPIEVAQAIIYLASARADAITGQKLVLNLGDPPFA